MELQHWFPGHQFTQKKNSSRENTSSEKNLGIFLLSFLGRVPAIFHWIHAGLCKCSFIAEIFNIKN